MSTAHGQPAWRMAGIMGSQHGAWQASWPVTMNSQHGAGCGRRAWGEGARCLICTDSWRSTRGVCFLEGYYSRSRRV